MTSAITTIVFDCFGVLYQDAFIQLVDRYTHGDPRLARPYLDIDNAFNHGFITDADYYAELERLSGETATVIKRHLRDTSVLNQPVADLVKTLHGPYRIGLLSNAERSFLDRFLANHNLDRHFDVVLASSETPFVKPERGIFAEMARRLDADFPEIAFIDDSTRNTEAASNYGMHTICYRNPRQLKQQLDAVLGK